VKKGVVKDQLKEIMSKFLKSGKHSFMLKVKGLKKKQNARKASAVGKDKEAQPGTENEEKGNDKDMSTEGECQEQEKDVEVSESVLHEEKDDEVSESVLHEEQDDEVSESVLHDMVVGDLVRMAVEVPGFEKLLGERCKVVLVAGAKVLLDPQAEHMFIKHWVPVEAVLKLQGLVGEAKLLPLRNMVHVSRQEKQNLLVRTGISDEVAGVLDDVLLKGKAMNELTDWHVDLFEACARWSFEVLEKDADYVPLRFCRLLIQGHTGIPQDIFDEDDSFEGVQAKHELRLKLLRRKFKDTQMLLMPVLRSHEVTTPITKTISVSESNLTPNGP
jgi:hypothetical protein